MRNGVSGKAIICDETIRDLDAVLTLSRLFYYSNIVKGDQATTRMLRQARLDERTASRTDERPLRETRVRAIFLFLAFSAVFCRIGFEYTGTAV